MTGWLVKFDMSGITRLLYRPHAYKERHYPESTRRTPEAMVRDGLSEKSTSYGQCQNRKHANSKGEMVLRLAYFWLQFRRNC